MLKGPTRYIAVVRFHSDPGSASKVQKATVVHSPLMSPSNIQIWVIHRDTPIAGWLISLVKSQTRMDDNWGVQSHGLEIPIEVYQKSSSELQNPKFHPIKFTRSPEIEWCTKCRRWTCWQVLVSKGRVWRKTADDLTKDGEMAVSHRDMSEDPFYDECIIDTVHEKCMVKQHLFDLSIFGRMNIHRLFWCELEHARVLTHSHFSPWKYDLDLQAFAIQLYQILHGFYSLKFWSKMKTRKINEKKSARIVTLWLKAMVSCSWWLIMVHTSASVKSYQLVKVVSGGRAPGKSSSLASPFKVIAVRNASATFN